MNTKALISIAVPAFNEAENLVVLADELKRVFETESNYGFEVIVCENGSSDNSFEILRALHNEDQRFKIVRLIRNFNMEGGMIAALKYVSGDACVIMSADLQDPPALIPSMIRYWEQGFENVYTKITHRHGESRSRRLAATWFYSVIHRLSGKSVPKNASDFRLVSRSAYESFNALPERVRLVRSTWAWLGYRSASIDYERPARTRGKSSFKPFVTAPYALRAILSTTFLPLRLVGVVGIGLCIVSLLSLMVSALLWVVNGVPFHGFGTLFSLQLLLFGILFGYLGILGEYISIIFEESRERPSFIVAEEIGVQSSSQRGNK